MLVGMAKWSGYRRFCSLSRALDLVGERWTLPLIQELLFEPARYNELRRRLPGIGSNVLAERLRKLEQHGIVRRRAEPIGQGVLYELTERGQGLQAALAELRRWGLTEHLMLDPNSPTETSYDMSYALPPRTDLCETYQWNVDDVILTLAINGTTLTQHAGAADQPAVIVTTTAEWLSKMLTGGTDWNAGRESGDVTVAGDEDAWHRMLVVTHQPGRQPTLPTIATT